MHLLFRSHHAGTEQPSGATDQASPIGHVHMVDCWMQLYDQWTGVDNCAGVSRHMPSRDVKTMRHVCRQAAALSLHGKHATAMRFSLCTAWLILATRILLRALLVSVECDLKFFIGISIFRAP
jgi:hypothetical protein